MIEQELINRIKSMLGDDLQVDNELVCSLLDNYISLIEQNAELNKELTKLKGDRVFVVNGGKPYDHNPPNDLAM